MVAAKFLKKTGLSDVVLSRIWDLSDPTGKGYLDKPGIFVALKLVSLAQAGHDINMRNIYMDTNAPKVVNIYFCRRIDGHFRFLFDVFIYLYFRVKYQK